MGDLPTGMEFDKQERKATICFLGPQIGPTPKAQWS